MAITATHYQLLKSLPIERGSSLLEIGEANWYGEIEPDFPCDSRELFAVAKAMYAGMFVPESICSIDMNGTPAALKFDLNQPFTLPDQFDVVINHGTAEHIFNIAQVFKTMHDHCNVNGWLIHDAPFTGWINHGFYCLQPTLFYDLAHANCYEVALVAVHEIKSRMVIQVNSREDFITLRPPDNSMLFVSLRKRVDQPFKLPMQGYYARTISETAKKAWEVGR